MDVLKPRYIAAIVIGLFALAGACVWNIESIFDVLLGRGYIKKAYYDAFSIEEVQGKYSSFRVYVNQLGKPASGLYIDLGMGHVKSLETVTIEDMKLIGAGFSEELETTGNGSALNTGYMVYFEKGKATSYQIRFGGRLQVGGSPQGPFASRALTKQELIEIFGEPKSYGTVRIGWH